MNITLSPEETAELERHAAAVGTDVKTFLLHAVLDTSDCDEMSVSDIPYEQWKREFQSWIARGRSRNPKMDDDRESIYD